MDQVFELIKKEEERQAETLMLIPSENYSSRAVREAVGSVLGHKYAEGYPGKRYYQGNEVTDEIETLAQERGKEIFGLDYINVQPYSGSPANSAVLFGLLNPGEKVMGLKLSAGGHLTHGHPKVTFSGKYYESVQYDVEEDGRINYSKLEQFIDQNRPKLIFVGTTAYPYIFDFKKFGEMADVVGAWLVADISHIAGLVVAGVHPSPVPYVHLMTSTTHKTLRGPRGAIIGVTKKGLEKDPALGKKVDSAVFPGLQGGPHMNTIAGMAVAFEETKTKEFQEYAKRTVENAKVLADELKSLGFRVFGSENHLMVVDVGFEKGKEMAVALEKAGIVVNANTIPHDEAKPFKPSGIRIGTPAMSSRGMGVEEMKQIARWIKRVGDNQDNDEVLELVRRGVKEMCMRFPI
jgi:glycine hydroxymethyltransferase